jgi:flavin-binding protein dodecin
MHARIRGREVTFSGNASRRVWHYLPTRNSKGDAMSVAKVMELSARSPKSFEDAIKHGLERASSTVEQIKGAWIKEQKVEFDGKKVSGYIVNMQVTFVLKD